MAHLKSPEVTLITVSNSEYQVACSFGRFHPFYGFLNVLVELQNVPQQESEGVSHSRLLPEGFVGVGDSDFRNAHLMLIHTG